MSLVLPKGSRGFATDRRELSEANPDVFIAHTIATDKLLCGSSTQVINCNLYIQYTGRTIVLKQRPGIHSAPAGIYQPQSVNQPASKPIIYAWLWPVNTSFMYYPEKSLILLYEKELSHYYLSWNSLLYRKPVAQLVHVFFDPGLIVMFFELFRPVHFPENSYLVNRKSM
jgi:hypothetical protein